MQNQSYPLPFSQQPVVDFSSPLLWQAQALYHNGRYREVLALAERASPNEANNAALLNLAAISAVSIGERDKSVRLFQRILQIEPDYAEASNNLGNLFKEMKRYEEAEACYRQTLSLKPHFAETHNNLGVLFKELARYEEAEVCYRQALSLKPDHAEVYNNLGITLKALNRYEEAESSYRQALSNKPDYAEVHNNLGVMFQELKRYEDAEACYRHALSFKPFFAEARYNLGALLLELRRYHEAEPHLRLAVLLKPDYAEAYSSLGLLLKDLMHYEDAAACYQQALSIDPDHGFLYGLLLQTKMLICDWSGLKDLLAQLTVKIQANEMASQPFDLLGIIDSPSLQRKAAEIFVQTKHPINHAIQIIEKYPRHKKIRIGYFSADYHNHPVSQLTAELFEIHDRTQFDIIAFSFGPDTNHEIRTRVAAAFDQFIDVRNQSDQEVALLSRKMEIDIAVNLTGYTTNARTGIFALRAAPIQVNYLGYPGTLGAEYMDYLIADETVISEPDQQHYSEKIVYLPNSYQVNDRKRHISEKVYTRKELGLPETAFVFCCFNTNYKITPDTFDGWIRILKQVEISVLWLLTCNPAAQRNLIKEAVKRGIDASRLIFAMRMPLSEHLARYRHADLCLDTLPYNAHTTASDALWAGLPVLTCVGDAFASRVAASLLNAIRIPELITSTQEEYERLAVQLATHPEHLRRIRQKLAHNRLTTPLFDTPLFAQHIEAAYSAMYERYQADLPPEPIYCSSSG
jgi:predicted O-linked N-acetylglucosamine transferase (SPINDLY family)